MAKILVVSNILFPPVDAGSKKCMMSYISLLKDMGNEVWFLYSGIATDKQIKKAISFWGNYFVYYKYSPILRVVNYLKRVLIHNVFSKKYCIDFYYPVFGLDAFVRRFIAEKHIDSIMVNYIWMTSLFKHIKGKRRILFTHDCFTNKRERIQNEMYTLSPNQESTGLRRCDIILSIQDMEAIIFKFLAPSLPVYSVYMPIKFSQTLICKNKNILFFSGNSDINMNGISYFIDNVFKDLLKIDNNIMLLIGGGICKALKGKYSHSNIILQGYIDDVDAFYNQGDIAVNPVYQGTGLKIKTLESIAYGKVTIVHPHSIEGLYRQTESPALIARNKTAYIDFIVEYINNIEKINIIKDKSKSYIMEMNNFIKDQYKSIGF